MGTKEQIERVSVSDQVARGLINYIRREGLAVGERLPSLNDLAQKFGVAAPTIREAMRKLEGLGLLEFRHGSGVYVIDSVDTVLLLNQYSPDLDIEGLADLIEARSVVEPYLARLAAARRSAKHIEALRAALETSSRVLDDDARLNDSNITFHREIAVAAQSTVLGQVVSSLLEVHSSQQLRLLQEHGSRHNDYEEHIAILEAIEAGDAERAESLMRAHLVYLHETLGGSSPGLGQEP